MSSTLQAFFFLTPAIFFFRLDIDECTTNVHNCDPLAVCKNTVGCFHCTCMSGHEGDGTTCVVGDVSLFRYNNQALPLVLDGNAPIGLRTRGFCELKATDKELH